MRDPRDLMADAQARIISRLNQDIRTLRNLNDKLSDRNKSLERDSGYYRAMQKLAHENPIIQGMFEELSTAISLAGVSEGEFSDLADRLAAS
jgi:hypothetical protein